MRDRRRDTAGSTASANIGTSQQFVGGDQTLRLLYTARIVINYKLAGELGKQGCVYVSFFLSFSLLFWFVLAFP